jgi:hypothetical protein
MDDRPQAERRLVMLGQPCVTSGRTDNARSCRPRRRQLNSCVALDPGPHGSEWHRTRSSKRSLGGRRTWRPTPPSLRKRESDEAPSVRAVSLAISACWRSRRWYGVARPAGDARTSPDVSPPCSARHRRGQVRHVADRWTHEDARRRAGEDASRPSLGDTAGQRGCGGVRRQGLEPRTR